MKENAKNILSLSGKEALDFLMTSEQYHGFELPEYFDFDKVLAFVRRRVGERPYAACVSANAAAQPDVNFDILLNKDGRYAVRPLVLCNPYLYYFLTRELCRPSHWSALKDCFTAFDVPHITPCSLPVIPYKHEPFHRATTILNWWNRLEQRSSELSLEYRYMFITDITNCYGTVDPQTIDWALSRRGTNHATDANHAFATAVIDLLSDLQQGRNIGIPQGSTLFDLTGEIVLGYADLLLYEALMGEGITGGYEVLRYRDDYRIFCNDRDMLERISYTLQRVLESLNFRMNSGKTKISHSIVTDSIKPDKLAYIYNTPIFNKQGCDFDGLQKHLLYILLFGREHRDSGQLRVMLSDFDNRVVEQLKPREQTFSIRDDSGQVVDSCTVEASGRIFENIRAMCAICVQIAIENINSAHYSLRVASRMANSIKDEAERWDIIDKMCARLRKLPNNVYLQLWLQNITWRHDKETGQCPYDARLCRVVTGDSADPLWNNAWLRPELTKGFPQASVVNQDTLNKGDNVITFKETRAYDEPAY